jgi:hypothetical protein
MISQKRATKGGQVGTNGEFYEGGKFLPSTERPKGKPAKKGTGKREIEPYVWVVPPADGLRSIFAGAVGVYAKYDHATKTLTFSASDQTMAYYGMDRAECEARIAAFNSGERWFSPEQKVKKS